MITFKTYFQICWV